MINEIQDVLDEIKEEITDGIYLKLSNKLLKAFDTQNEFFTINYLSTDLIRNSSNDYKIIHNDRQQIVKGSLSQYNSISTILNNHKIIRNCSHLNLEDIFDQLINNNSSSIESNCCSSGVLLEEDCDVSHEITINNSILIIGISK